MLAKIKDNLYSLSQKYGRKMGLDLPYFIKNSYWVILRQSVEITAGLALSVAFARLASQEVFGQYQFILSIFATFSILSIPGFNTSIIKAAANGYDGEYPDIVKKSFFWSLLGIPVLMMIGAYYYVFQNHLLGIALMISAVFFPFFYAPNTWYNYLQGKNRFDVLARYGISQSLINTAATVAVLFFSRNNLVAITFTYLISYTFFNVFYYFKSLKYMENEKRDNESISYGFFLTKLSIIGVISNNIDKLLIGIFLPASQLAVYSIGILFTRQIQSFSKGLLWIVSVKAIKQKILSRKYYLLIFIGGIAAAGLFMILFKYLIPLLFSDKYSASIILSEITIVFFPFFLLTTIYGNEITFNSEKKVLLKNSFISPLILIVLNILVLPIFGIKGLAFLSGFQYIIFLSVVYLLRRSGRRASAGK